MTDLQAFLDSASIDPAVAALRPDYRVMLLAAEGIAPQPSDEFSENLLERAEASVTDGLEAPSVTEVPHVAAWREAYKAFGAKPQRTRNSLEALMRRAEKGLPRVNRLTDVYNAVSVLHRIPLGGENLLAYEGAPRLAVADGSEDFDTFAGGEDVVEHPEPGEVVWRDDAGVTCRRWNWRQCRRTALTDETTTAFFIMDALEPLSDADLEAAADELQELLGGMGDDVVLARRLVRAGE